MLISKTPAAEPALDRAESATPAAPALRAFEEPRLEPRGDISEVTAGGFGGFSP